MTLRYPVFLPVLGLLFAALFLVLAWAPVSRSLATRANGQIPAYSTSLDWGRVLKSGSDDAASRSPASDSACRLRSISL